MRLTLSQIETFYWIGRLGSFHAAARHLNVTQPSVSGRIRELELELGTSMFDRSGGRARLTAAGRAIQAQAEQMLALAREIHDEAGAGKLGGLLRLGVVETVAHLALPGLMGALKQRRPDLRVELAVDVGAVLMRQLEERQLDAVISNETTSMDGVVSQVLGQVDLAWVGPAGHGLTGQVLTPATLRDETIFTQPPQSTIGRATRAWFDMARETPKSLSTCNSLSVISKLVAEGLGFAIVTPALLSPELASRISRFEADPPIETRRLTVAALREIWSSDIDFVAGFVANAFRHEGALRE